MKKKDRISKAIEIADRYGSTDGAHHKMWVIDQMIRVLTDCPVIESSGTDCRGNTYTFKIYGESKTYNDFVRNRIKDGYEWDVGIAP